MAEKLGFASSPALLPCLSLPQRVDEYAEKLSPSLFSLHHSSLVSLLVSESTYQKQINLKTGTIQLFTKLENR